MIQCVGSREPDHSYCSRVCCTAAVKNSLKLKELNPRRRGFGSLPGYPHLRFEGALLPGSAAPGGPVLPLRIANRSRPWRRTVSSCRCRSSTPTCSSPSSFDADLLVLSAAIRPRTEGKQLAETLRLPAGSGRLLPGSAPQTAASRFCHRRASSCAGWRRVPSLPTRPSPRRAGRCRAQ